MQGLVHHWVSSALGRGVTFLKVASSSWRGQQLKAICQHTPSSWVVSPFLRRNLGTWQGPQQASTSCRGEVKEWRKKKINDYQICSRHWTRYSLGYHLIITSLYMFKWLFYRENRDSEKLSSLPQITQLGGGQRKDAGFTTLASSWSKN